MTPRALVDCVSTLRLAGRDLKHFQELAASRIYLCAVPGIDNPDDLQAHSVEATVAAAHAAGVLLEAAEAVLERRAAWAYREAS